MKPGELFRNLSPAREDAGGFTRARLDARASWLTPRSGEAGVGRDSGYQNAFFTLKDEGGELSAIDDGLIIRSCEQLLKVTGKDLRLPGY